MKEVIMKLMLLAGSLLTTESVFSANYDFEVDGLYYNVVSLPDMTAEVAQVNKSYNHDALSIPEHVTYMGRAFQIVKIREYAFSGCDSLTSVTIPGSVTEIGNSAFSSCNNLTSVAIPNSVTEIGSSAFGRCKKLTSITISSNITEIKSGTFWGCESLTSITIPNNVTKIGVLAFSGCKSLISVKISNTVTEIGNRAFEDCNSLTSITIPQNVSTIEGEAFSGCSSLDSIIIQSNAVEYKPAMNQGSTFKGCWNISFVRITKSVNSIGSGIISFPDDDYYHKRTIKVIIDDCEQQLKIDASVSNSVEMVYYGRDISNRIFTHYSGGRTKLREMYISDYVTNFPYHDYSFHGNLELITIGKKISEVPDLSRCESLNTLVLNSEVPPTATNFSNVQYMNVKVYVPKGALAAYQSADVWKNFWNLQESETTDIDDVITNTQTAKELKRYNAAGREIDNHHRGLNVIRMSDGTTKKVIVK